MPISKVPMRTRIARFNFLRGCLATALACVACNSVFGINDPKHREPEACILNSDCAIGQVCVFRLCSPPCASDVDCVAVLHQHCLKTNDGAACVSDSQSACGVGSATQCPSGTVCTDGRCYAECFGTSRCADGHICEDGACKGSVGDSGTGGGRSNSGHGRRRRSRHFRRARRRWW